MNKQLLAQSFTINGTGATINGPLENISTLGDVVNKILPFTIAFGGIALFLILMWGGYDFLMSQGNPEKINNGKSYILYAIIGLLLAIFGFVFIQVIAIDILHIPGFK